MLVHRRVTPSSKFASTHLYTWVERSTMRVKCLAQEHNAAPRPFDLESSALTIRPPCLPYGTLMRATNLIQLQSTIYKNMATGTVFKLVYEKPENCLKPGMHNVDSAGTNFAKKKTYGLLCAYWLSCLSQCIANGKMYIHHLFPYSG